MPRHFLRCRRKPRAGPARGARGGFRLGAALTLAAGLVLAGIGAARAAGPVPAEERLWGTVRAAQSSTQLTVVSPDRGPLPVRLLGVELPEPPRPSAGGKAEEGQPFGQQAITYLRELILGKQVVLTTYGKDRAGRLLSVVWLGEINVNVTLVKEGLAWVVPSLKDTAVRAALDVAERQARVGRYGLWALPNPEAPWDFRRRNSLAAK